MSRKTLLVDDDAISALLTKHLLKIHDFSTEVTTFYQAEEALQYLIENIAGDLPDLILLDLNMPVWSGWDFLEALAPYESLLRPSCQIFILTSSLEYADQVRSQGYALVTGFMQKPISLQDIERLKLALAKS